MEWFQATLQDVPSDEMPDTDSLLAAGADQALDAKGLDPVLRADMLTTIGDIYRVRGRHDEANRMLDQARQLATASREETPEVYARAVIAWSTLLPDTEKHETAIEDPADLVVFLEKHAPDSAFVLKAPCDLCWKLALIRQNAEALKIIQAVTGPRRRERAFQA